MQKSNFTRLGEPAAALRQQVGRASEIIDN